MKKILALILSLCLLTALFAGCSRMKFTDSGSKKKTSPATAETVPETLPVTEETDEPFTADEGISPLFWRVTAENGNVLYLFGTIHIGDERNDQVAGLVLPYLKECEALSVEVNVVAEENDPETSQKLMMMYLLSDGTSIRDHLPEDVLKDASALLKEYGFDPAIYGFDSFNAAMWDQLVQQAIVELETEFDFSAGVDRKLIEMASRRNIPVLEVEDPDAHYGFELKYPDWVFARSIRETLDARESSGEELQEMYEAYLSGDASAFLEEEAELTEEEESFIEENFTAEEKAAYFAGDLSPVQVSGLLLKYATDEQIQEWTGCTRAEAEVLTAYEKEMMDDRNQIMFKGAKKYLETYKTAMLAVGAAHYQGAGGLIRLFEKEGYTVEEIRLN